MTDAVFVVAEVGQKLNWIRQDNVFDFWKTDLQKHLWDTGDKLYLDKASDGYAYLATEWVDNANRK
ncbi:hypothetical protein WSM22_46860 [Cytophagales bacterium WSM2-2]|nr:hypothetical protein WSM22_46860 [Cytophagales bacterium WSM2-2]